MRLSQVVAALAAPLLLAIAQPACAGDPAPAAGDQKVSIDEPKIESYQFNVELSALSDMRTRGTSDSLMQPGAKVGFQFAHESGFVALLEINNVSSLVFSNSVGVGILTGGVYRFGDPSAWHAGVGLAAEFLPNASYTAPHQFDATTFTPGDYRKSDYNSQFGVFELGYGPIEGRMVVVLSKNFRGANTGGVCGQVLQFSADPTAGLNCYARGDHDSRGTLLFDLNYKTAFLPEYLPSTTLRLHAGYQWMPYFSEAGLADFGIGLTHKHWGLDWNLDFTATIANNRTLYMVQDGDRIRHTDSPAVIASIVKKF